MVSFTLHCLPKRKILVDTHTSDELITFPVEQVFDIPIIKHPFEIWHLGEVIIYHSDMGLY